MELTRPLVYLVCIFASLTAQANESVPLLPTSPQAPRETLSSRALEPFSLELKSQAMADWQRHDSAITSGRLAARLYGQSALSGPLGIELNTKLRTQGNSREPYQAQNNIRLDLQSLAFSYTPSSSWRWVAGRTNIRNGVASGFNPTDWFKDNSQVIFESLDTADRREDRLGVVALEGVWLSEESVLSFGYRPNLHIKPDTVASNSNVVGLGLDRTNNKNAFFIKYAPSPAAWNNLSLTVSSLYESDRPSLGAEVSMAVLDNVVLYNEWFGQRRQNLTDEAMRSSRGDWRIYHQLASGITWSVPESMVGNEDVALSIEYHVNEAGLKQSQLGTWRSAIAQDNRQARSIARLAASKQEPLVEQQFFSRLAWYDFWEDNDLSFITAVTPMDGSGFGQLTLSAPIKPNMRLDLQGYHYFGSSNTIYGTAGRKDGWMLSFIFTL